MQQNHPVTQDQAARKRYYIDCEFDGHNGPLLSIAVVPEEGCSIHIETLATDTARDPWVVENVVARLADHQAESIAIVTVNEVGRELRDFLRDDPAPVIVADSPVDIGRFCAALMTSEQGGYEPNAWAHLTFEVHDVDCYPTDLPGAVQHNAWWDAMALRHRLATRPASQEGAVAEGRIEVPTAATGKYEPLHWQVVTDAQGFESIYETDEDGRPGDLVASVFGDNATLLVAAPRLRSALTQLLAIAGTPTTERQERVFGEARAALRPALTGGPHAR